MRSKGGPGFKKLSGKRGNHARHNGHVANGNHHATQWKPGEMRELIEKALQEGRVTKCQSADVSQKPVFGFDDSNFEGGKI